MRLDSISVKKYRSIAHAEKLQLADLTVLVGPNNEGKSNLLQALVTGMRYLGGAPRRGQRSVGRRRSGLARAAGFYDWDRDFPQSLQLSEPNGSSIFDFRFRMTDQETRTLENLTGHRLNGELPVRLRFGRSGEPEFSVPKQRSGPSLSQKKDEIRAFVAQRVAVQYIPAVRTMDAALDVVDDLVQREIDAQTETDEYAKAIQKVAELQQPIWDALAKSLQESLGQLLPDIKSVTVEVTDRAYRPPASVRLIVDDGNLTDLALKGDGVQSLAAISLSRHYATETNRSAALILAVEEPEAHLHPDAVHGLRRVLADIAGTQQVVITTHSPLLVNRMDVGSNVIVEQTRARPAKSVAELRSVLGVRTSDNLAGADLVVVVEGPDDRLALQAVLCQRSRTLAAAANSGAFQIFPIHGAGGLKYALSHLRDSLCLTHAFLDDDMAGRDAANQARELGLLTTADQTFAKRLGQTNSELEDLFAPAVYRAAVMKSFNVDVTASLGKGKSVKWSDRMKLLFGSQGQLWDDKVQESLKQVVAEAVAANVPAAVDPKSEDLFTSLIKVLEIKLTAARR